jgi:hypothetical protein
VRGRGRADASELGMASPMAAKWAWSAAFMAMISICYRQEDIYNYQVISLIIKSKKKEKKSKNSRC